MASLQVGTNGRKPKIPPFLKKLVDLTNSCPPHIGSWNEEGTQFVVKSSQFADLLREQFQGTLQTFVRQLHFYSFRKKDSATGTWVFSHPHFLRGQPHLLVNIARKSNPKRSKSNGDDEDHEDNSSAEAHVNEALEAKISHLERQVSRITSLERELQALKQEVVAFKELAAAQNLLSLAPGFSKKRGPKDEPSKEERVEIAIQVANNKLQEKDDMLSLLPPPKKVTRLTSVDSAFELKDFPFEDTSSLGSVSVRDLMRELQYGIFSDFDEFMPSATKLTNAEAPSSADPASDTTTDLCKDKEDFFKIPQGFELQNGVTMSLLKQTFNIIGKMCCPNASGAKGFAALQKLVDERPHPDSLPPVEQCEITHELLPTLREHVTEEASDLAIMRAARHVYEIYYSCVTKKLQEKTAGMKAHAEAAAAATGSSCS